jgi:hypothetical protein
MAADGTLIIDTNLDTSGAEKGASNLKNIMSGAAKGISVAFAAVGAGVVAMVTKSVSAFAEYEQLIGGVETLFKDSADTVKQYADNAFKTAGMSANEYMETVTSFSASLLQGLGGDTEKAAQVADMAITDMADNANKMGTSIASIQNAYQGFAKQNYTMLDNLKLGYGGTKTEMERLLADAEKFSGVKYDISNLNDVFEAIHVIQTELEITGTTALEASTTIQGSANAMKAAWTNLLTGMADETQDFGVLLENFISSASTFLDNLLPHVEVALGGVVDLVAGLAPKIATELPKLVSKLLPKISKLAVDLLKALTSGILKNIKQLTKTAVDVVNSLVKGLISALPMLLDAGMQLLVGIVEGIADALPELIPAVVDIVEQMIETLIDNLPMIWEAGMQLLEGLVAGILKALPKLIEAIPKLIKSYINAIVTFLPKIIESGVEILLALVDGIISAIPELVAAIPEIIAAIVGGLLAGVDEVLAAAAELFFGIKNEAKAARESLEKHIESITDFSESIKDATPVVADYNKLLSENGRTIRDIDSAIEETENAITNILSEALKAQQDLRHEDLVKIREYMDELNALQEEKMQIYYDHQIAQLRKLMLDKNDLQQEDAAQHLANSQAAYDAASAAADEFYTAELTRIENYYASEGMIGSQSYQNAQAAAKASYDARMADIQGFYNEAVSTVSTASEEWVMADAEKWAQMTQAFSEFNSESQNYMGDFLVGAGEFLGSFNAAKTAYTKTLDGMNLDTANAFLKMQAEVKSGGGEITGSAKELAKNMLGAFDNLPDSLDAIGKDTLLGMVGGLSEQIPGLENISKMSANEIVDTIKFYLGIASPSKVLDGVGSDAVLGLMDGMEKQLKTLTNQARSVGKNLTDGIGSGITSGIPSLLSIAKSAANRVMSTIKKNLGIASRSKLGIEVGANVSEAIGYGFEKNIRASMDTIKNSLNLETSRLQSGMSVIGGTSTTYSPSYTFNSPDALGTREVLMQIAFDKQQARLYGLANV